MKRKSEKEKNKLYHQTRKTERKKTNQSRRRTRKKKNNSYLQQARVYTFHIEILRNLVCWLSNSEKFSWYSSSLFFSEWSNFSGCNFQTKNFGIELKQVYALKLYRSNYKIQLCAKFSRSHQASRIDAESLWRWPSPIMQSCPISDVWKNFQKGIIKFICWYHAFFSGSRPNFSYCLNYKFFPVHSFNIFNVFSWLVFYCFRIFGCHKRKA